MGADYSSYAIIGIKIDPKKLITTKKIRGCECDIVPTGKFCPNCGNETWEEAEDEYDEEELFYGYEVIFGTDREEAYIAAIYAEGDDYKNCFKQIPDDIDSLRKKMKNTLGPKGLWNEKNFGLWSVLYCSY